MNDLQAFLDSGDSDLRAAAKREQSYVAWRRYWATVPAPAPHTAPNFRSHERNEFGKWQSRFLCGTCGVEFAVCPALLPDETADTDCLSPDCASYSIDRDPLMLLAIGEASAIREASND